MTQPHSHIQYEIQIQYFHAIIPHPQYYIPLPLPLPLPLPSSSSLHHLPLLATTYTLTNQSINQSPLSPLSSFFCLSPLLSSPHSLTNLLPQLYIRYVLMKPTLGKTEGSWNDDVRERDIYM